MNKDRKKSIYSDSSIPDRGGHLLPLEPIAFVKPIVVNRAYRRASVPDYWNVEKSPAIPRA